VPVAAASVVVADEDAYEDGAGASLVVSGATQVLVGVVGAKYSDVEVVVGTTYEEVKVVGATYSEVEVVVGATYTDVLVVEGASALLSAEEEDAIVTVDCTVEVTCERWWP